MKEPIIAIEQGSILAFATKNAAEKYLELIDIENEEYELFDAEGIELHAQVVNHWTPIELKEAIPKRKKPEYLKSQIAAFLGRRGENVNYWKKASLKEVVQKVTTDYPTK